MSLIKPICFIQRLLYTRPLPQRCTPQTIDRHPKTPQMTAFTNNLKPSPFAMASDGVQSWVVYKSEPRPPSNPQTSSLAECQHLEGKWGASTPLAAVADIGTPENIALSYEATLGVWVQPNLPCGSSVLTDSSVVYFSRSTGRFSTGHVTQIPEARGLPTR